MLEQEEKSKTHTGQGDLSIAEKIKDEVYKTAQGGTHDIMDELKAEHRGNDISSMSLKFQLIATLVIILCAVAGIGAGFVMSEQHASEDLVSWMALPGDLFIRALKCIVLPLIFVNVIIAMIQLIDAGKAGTIGKHTVMLYTLTTCIAACEGLFAVFMFQDKFSTKPPDVEHTFFSLLCPYNDYVMVQSGNDLICTNASEVLDDYENAAFKLDNPNNFFVTNGESFAQVSFSDTLQDGIFRKMVSDNIVGEFANGGFIGIIMFAIVFGAAASAMTRAPVLLLEFMEDVNGILIKIIEWIIYMTPIAVFSLVAGALGAQPDIEETFSDIKLLLGAGLLAIGLHFFVSNPTVFFIFTRQNPFVYMKYLFPAQIFAFACASSAATLPLTLKCVKSSGMVPDSIRDFVLPVGATVNMDGTAAYFPAALVFLARTSGLETGLTEIILIFIVSTIGSAGTAPVPSGSLVLIITAFNTVYGGTGTPNNFALVVAIDWFMGRCRCLTNVTGDSLIARIVTVLSGLEVEADEPASRVVATEEEI